MGVIASNWKDWRHEREESKNNGRHALARPHIVDPIYEVLQMKALYHTPIYIETVGLLEIDRFEKYRYRAGEFDTFRNGCIDQFIGQVFALGAEDPHLRTVEFGGVDIEFFRETAE